MQNSFCISNMFNMSKWQMCSLFTYLIRSALCDWQCRNRPGLLSFNSRVSFVGVGFIKLERDLPYNVSTAWKPALHRFDCEYACIDSTAVAAMRGRCVHCTYWLMLLELSTKQVCVFHKQSRLTAQTGRDS